MSVCALYAYKGPWRPEDPLELELEEVVSALPMLRTQSGPLQEQEISLTHPSSPNMSFFFYCFFFYYYVENFIVQKGPPPP